MYLIWWYFHDIIKFYNLAEDSVWGDVMGMKDAIKVEYGRLEELFSQKETHHLTPTSAGGKIPFAKRIQFLLVRAHGAPLFFF